MTRGFGVEDGNVGDAADEERLARRSGERGPAISTPWPVRSGPINPLDSRLHCDA